MNLPSLHSRPLLHKLFRLAFLCLDEPFQNLPAATFGSGNSDASSSSLVDVLLPVQSYFRNVSHSVDSVEAVTTEQSIASYLQLEPKFGGNGLSDVNDPWLSVDFFLFFGRTNIL